LAVEPFLATLFGGHGVHLSSPEKASANVLAGQELHDTAPGWLEPPAGQTRHSVEFLAPTVVE
jgi:hypothetical protein